VPHKIQKSPTKLLLPRGEGLDKTGVQIRGVSGGPPRGSFW